MEYFDLNLRPVVINYNDRLNAISDLIVNAIRQYHNQEYATKLIIDYDERTGTLKIKDHGTGINLTDFVQKQDSNDDWFATGLRTAISGLMASQVSIIFKSNFGIFTPTIRNKEGLSQNISSIFIAYEPANTTNDQWTNLKDINEDESTNSNHGTEVTICPLPASFVADLKYNFSFLLPWVKEIKTHYGTLLVNKEKQMNDIFVDGENVTHMHEPDEDDDDKSMLVFSYDINYNAFDPNLIKNRYNKPGRYAYDCMCAIYDELNDEDKEFVYSKLLNNHDSIEWNNEMVRDHIIEHYAKTNPDKYLIGTWNKENTNYVEFAKLAHKEIIWVKSNDELNKLTYLPINTVDNFGAEYAKQNFNTFVPTNKLTARERTNWEALQSFLTYFIDANKEIQDQLTKVKLDKYNIKIVENLPTDQSFYRFDENAGIINRKILDGSFADLLDKCEIIIYIPTGNITWHDFNNLWYQSIANYIIASNKDAPKEALN